MAAHFTVFVDRDGVFDVDPRIAVFSWKQFRWLPGAAQAFSRLNQANICTSLATNQPYVGLGLLPRWTIDRIHHNLQAELAAAGGRLDNVEAAMAPSFFMSRRRKPRPGMLEDGAARLRAAGWMVSTSRAVMVGDRLVDAQAAGRFGIPAILLATGTPEAVLSQRVANAKLPDVVVVPDLAAAVDIILQRAAARPSPEDLPY